MLDKKKNKKINQKINYSKNTQKENKLFDGKKELKCESSSIIFLDILYS